MKRICDIFEIGAASDLFSAFWGKAPEHIYPSMALHLNKLRTIPQT